LGTAAYTTSPAQGHIAFDQAFSSSVGLSLNVIDASGKDITPLIFQSLYGMIVITDVTAPGMNVWFYVPSYIPNPSSGVITLYGDPYTVVSSGGPSLVAEREYRVGFYGPPGLPRGGAQNQVLKRGGGGSEVAYQWGWPVPIIASIPQFPTDEDEILLFKAGMPGPWHLRYSQAKQDLDGYGWEFLGGTSMLAEVATSDTYASATYGDPTGVGPQLTAPWNGIYRIQGSAYLATPATLAAIATAAVKLGAAATADAERIAVVQAPAAAVTANLGTRMMERTLAAAAVAKMQYKSSTGTLTTTARSLEMIPVRLKR